MITKAYFMAAFSDQLWSSLLEKILSNLVFLISKYFSYLERLSCIKLWHKALWHKAFILQSSSFMQLLVLRFPDSGTRNLVHSSLSQCHRIWTENFIKFSNDTSARFGIFIESDLIRRVPCLSRVTKNKTQQKTEM